MKKIDFMQYALKEANKAFEKGEVPVGAIIVKDNKIISRGYNLKETKQNVTRHAEIIAIEKACKKINSWHLEECEMFVTLEPCMMCCGAILQSRLKKVTYGLENIKLGYLNTVELYNFKTENKKLLIEEKYSDSSLELLQKFFINKR